MRPRRPFRPRRSSRPARRSRSGRRGRHSTGGVLCSDAAVLGVLQGLTEFLPISSTAHLLIGERLLGFDDPGGVFTVMIQLGSILAIMWLYRARILQAWPAFDRRRARGGLRSA